MSTTVAYARARAGTLARLSDYLELAKPRISLLVLATVAVAAIVAARGQPDMLRLLHTLLGTALVAAGASACNHVLERRTDALMPRTADRPLAAGRLRVAHVVVLAVASALGGCLWLLLGVGAATAATATACWLLYVCVYTPLKRRTTWNTVVGAVAGALPVWIGWTSQRPLDLHAATLFMVLYLWQFPHFMAIAWMYRDEYRRAGLRMLPVVDPSGCRAARQAVAGAMALVPLGMLPLLPLPGSAALQALALLLGTAQLVFAIRFFLRLDEPSARALLRASLVYLPLWMALLLATPWGA
jgi:protoheme IX farnesyltransferase